MQSCIHFHYIHSHTCICMSLFSYGLTTPRITLILETQHSKHLSLFSPISILPLDFLSLPLPLPLPLLLPLPLPLPLQLAICCRQLQSKDQALRILKQQLDTSQEQVELRRHEAAQLVRERKTSVEREGEGGHRGGKGKKEEIGGSWWRGREKEEEKKRR